MAKKSIADSNDQCARKIEKALIDRMGEQKFLLWFGVGDFSVSGETLVIKAPHAMAEDWIRRHFQGEIKAALDAVGCAGMEVSIEAKQEKAGAVVRGQSKAEVAQQLLFLPTTAEYELACPNHFARSDLFMPMQGKAQTTYKNDRTIVSRKDAKMVYSGFDLSMFDYRVWLWIVREGSMCPLGEWFVFKAVDCLRDLGMLDKNGEAGGKQYKQLHEAMKRLRRGEISIQATKYAKGFLPDEEVLRLFDGGTYRSKEMVYRVRLDKFWFMVFGNKEFTLIDKRKHDKMSEMALRLQLLVCASDTVAQEFDLDELQARMHYECEAKKFKFRIKAAAQELVEAKVLKFWKFVPNRKTRKDDLAVMREFLK